MKNCFVILAGGAGERLWPLSRRGSPKPLLSLNGGSSLVTTTIQRIRPLLKPGSLWVVCARSQARLIRDHLARGPRAAILAEPVGRNTAAAIGLAAHHLLARGKNPVMVILPSDHWIAPHGSFRADLRRACAFVRRRPSAFVVFGVPPTGPHTGYGYVKVRRQRSPHPGFSAVDRFIEKPTPRRASAYLKEGGFFWNSGMFVARAQTILGMIERDLKPLHRLLKRWDELPAVSRDLWYRRLPAVSIDVGLLEKGGDLWLQKASFQWSDLGDLKEVGRLLAKFKSGNRTAGPVVLEGCSDTHVAAQKRLVCAVGVSRLTVVETDRAVLVLNHDHIGRMRHLVRRLARSGKRAFL